MMTPPRPWLFVVLALSCSILASCTPRVGIRESSSCDGELDPGEETVDSVYDEDGDGFFDGDNPDCAATYAPEILDCDDSDAAVHPEADEVPCNGLDDDCSEATPDTGDVDGDGYDSCEDCDDDEFDVNPGMDEVLCDGLDNDCSEESLDEVDADGDGVSVCDDCDDEEILAVPGGEEIECDGIDNDCDSATLDGPDGDSDGSSVCEDCDDAAEWNFPGNEEVCDDGLDNDCDGTVDENCSPDYSGLWLSAGAISYSCAFSLVTINFSTLTVSHADPTIIFQSPSGQPGSIAPPRGRRSQTPSPLHGPPPPRASPRAPRRPQPTRTSGPHPR